MKENRVMNGNNLYYLQIYNYIKHMIDSSRWMPGDRLSSLDELAETFGVSRLTARQATQLLAREGYLKSRRGKGTFVLARERPPQLTIRTKTDWSSLLEVIRGARTEILLEEDGITSLPDAYPGEFIMPEYHRIKRVHSYGGERFALCDLYLDQTVFDRTPELFRRQSIMTTLDQLTPINIKDARQIIVCSKAGLEGARYLGITIDDTVVDIRRYVTSDNGTLIYFGNIMYRSNYIQLEVDLITRKTKVITGQ